MKYALVGNIKLPPQGTALKSIILKHSMSKCKKYVKNPFQNI